MPYGGSAEGEIHLKKTLLLAGVTWGNRLHLSCEGLCEVDTDHPELWFCISQEENEASNLSSRLLPSSVLGCVSLSPLSPSPCPLSIPGLAKWANAYFRVKPSTPAKLPTLPVAWRAARCSSRGSSPSHLHSGVTESLPQKHLADPFFSPNLRWYLFTSFSSWPCSPFVMRYWFVWHLFNANLLHKA